MNSNIVEYFNDKTIWVTGSASGIGRAIAKNLADIQCKLILSDVNEPGLQVLSNELNNPHTIFSFDHTSTEKIEFYVEQALAQHHTIDIIILCVGQGCRATFEETSLETAKRIMEINFFSAIAISKSILPHFKQKQSGHIIVINSVTGKIGARFRTAYSASKSALTGFYNSLRYEVDDDNIHISQFYPAFVDTPMRNNTWNGKGEKAIINRKKVKQLTADECAREVLNKSSKKIHESVLGKTVLQKQLVNFYKFLPRTFYKISKNSTL